MGKGVVSSFFPQVAERGYQLVYGAIANRSPTAPATTSARAGGVRAVAAVADLDTFKVLPWEPRVARVFCDCYAPRPASCSTLTAARTSSASRTSSSRSSATSFLIGIEPR